jgi:formate hydrogenlyase subunit 3/multisubunit Na+/H+ antiporter MnhD subunit
MEPLKEVYSLLQAFCSTASARSARWNSESKGLRTKIPGILFFLGAAGLAGIAPTGLSIGEDLIHNSADTTGYPWVKWIFLFTGSLTAAAVFRVGGRIFLGWGDTRQRKMSSTPKNEERQETQFRPRSDAL